MVVELLSSQTTTQNYDSAHAGHLITLAMPSTADKHDNDAAVEQDNMAMLAMNGQVTM